MIRTFIKSDINEIMRIWKNENIRTHNFIPKNYWEENYEYVKSILPNSDVFVYVNRDEIEGFIGIQDNYIAGIFIDINSQNKGIGTLLLDKVKENTKKLTLKVYKKNIKAIKFYEKNNFKIIAEDIDMQTGEKEYTMEWESELY